MSHLMSLEGKEGEIRGVEGLRAKPLVVGVGCGDDEVREEVRVGAGFLGVVLVEEEEYWGENGMGGENSFDELGEGERK